MSCHVVALDTDGSAWLFGRNAPAALGGPLRGEPQQPDAGVVSENAPRHLTARMLGAPGGTRFVHAAAGRGHTLLVGSNGDVWSAGVNTLGQVFSFPRNYFSFLSSHYLRSADIHPARKCLLLHSYADHGQVARRKRSSKLVQA